MHQLRLFSIKQLQLVINILNIKLHIITYIYSKYIETENAELWQKQLAITY